MGFTRRSLLTSAGLTVLSARLPGRLAFGQPTGRNDTVLVSIFLRGGMDGLMAAPPVELSELNRLRPDLALERSGRNNGGIVDLDGRFGLHPAFAPLLPYWDDQRLALVHGVGSPSSTRSHFDAQDFMETATPGVKGTRSGWLNRTAELLGATRHSPLGAVALADRVPRSFAGPTRTVTAADLALMSLGPKSASIEELERMWDTSAEGSLEAGGASAFEVLRLLDREEFERYKSKHARSYPDSSLGRRLMQIAFLIKQRVGLRIAFADSDGWDTHARQTSYFSWVAGDLASSIAAFWEDIEEFQHNVVVLTMTEFGRAVGQNGARGTDHGHASCWFALGDRVDGGRVYGELPSLSRSDLYQGRDLHVTTDFRSVFAEMSGSLFDIDADGSIFPGWSGPRSRILR